MAYFSDRMAEIKAAARRKDAMPGYVYVLTAARMDGIKVGSSSNPRRRLSGLRSAVPLDLSLFSCVECRDRSEAFRIERQVHKFLEPVKRRREWFDFCPYQATKIIEMTRDGRAREFVGPHLRLWAIVDADDSDLDEIDKLRSMLQSAQAYMPTELDQWRENRRSDKPLTISEPPFSVPLPVPS